jgi:hypothetical protein
MTGSSKESLLERYANHRGLRILDALDVLAREFGVSQGPSL